MASANGQDEGGNRTAPLREGRRTLYHSKKNEERGPHALHELSRGVASNPLSIFSIQADFIVVKLF